MTNFSNYLEEQLLGHTLLGSTYTSPVTVFMSLATSIASDGDSYTEVTTNMGYARVIMHGKMSSITSQNDNTVVNSQDITFAAATTPWGIVLHFAVFDSATIGAGNMLYWGDLSTSRDVQTNDVVEFQAGNLSVRLD